MPRCELTTLPPAILQNLTNLTVLRLPGNHLRCVPSELSRLTNLQRIDLSNQHRWCAMHVCCCSFVKSVKLQAVVHGHLPTCCSGCAGVTLICAAFLHSTASSS